MDPITHGIAGALLGKAYFSKGPGESEGRIAVFAVTLGAVFPDIDVIADAFSRDPLAIARYHRGFTHSFVGMTLIAIALAWLTRWCMLRRGRDCPSFAVLATAYGVGIASHILLDATTSFGTRLWNPLASTRVAWDLIFIIDFILTAILLLPQVSAWIYRDAARSARRAAWMWVTFTLAAVGVWQIANAFGYGFARWIVLAASVAIAALFFLPASSGWGFRLSRASWCRAGVYAALAYVLACMAAHHAAMARVEAFAAERGLAAERMAAIPMPPSLLDWSGLILTAEGDYQAHFDLRDARAPTFSFSANSPPNQYTAAARELPDVKVYLWFARFPVTRYSQQGDLEIIDYSDLRFFGERHEAPQPFTFRVVLDASGRLVDEGWVGVSTFPMRRIKNGPQPGGNSR